MPTNPRTKERQPQLRAGAQNIPNRKMEQVMHPFNGQWLPSIDAALIGGENYQELINMRYGESGLEGVNGHFDFNATKCNATYDDIKTGIHFRTNRADDSYLIVRGEDGSGNGRLYYSTSAVGSAEGTGSFEATQIHSDASANLDGRFATGPSGVVAYCNQEESLIWGGTEANISDAFLLEVDAAPNYGKITDSSANDWSLPKERTEKLLNQLIADYATMSHDTVGGGDPGRVLLILTTRPCQGIKLYVDPSNPNTNAANTNALEVEYWNGSSFAAVAGLSDGTSKLTTTGTLSFNEQSDAAPLHYEERYLYAYIVILTATAGDSEARIYQATVDMPIQAPTDVWDGIYRTPVAVQRYDNANGTYEDFTVHVSETSTVGTPVGLYLGQLAAADHFIIMSEEQLSALQFTMLGSLVNTNNAQFAAAGGLKYWDGNSFENLTFTDGTLDDAGDSSCAQSGLISWQVPSDEEKTTRFGITGYAYKFQSDAAFVGAADDDVVVDIIGGVPAQKGIEVYKFPSQYKNKLMMCGYVEGNEGNRIDYSVDNAPDVFNGEDSSMDGFQSIFVGSVEEITAATQLYNRFGSNIFSTFVILKNNEVWLLKGDGPLDYELFPISFRVGCPAPYTLTTAEVGFEVGEQVERNVAMWISAQGPVLFDGAIIHPLEGVEKYFDPNETGSVNFTYLSSAQSWFDSTYNEWNILLPTGSTAALDLWLVYDVRKKRWFQKDTNLGQAIQCGIAAIANSGDQYVYAGGDDGRLYELETGTSWNGAAITYTITTGDFFPSGNQWDITMIRRLKLVTKRLEESGASVSIFYQKNTDSDAGVALTWQDVTALRSNSSTAGLAWTDAGATITNSGTAGLSFFSAPAELMDMSIDQGLNRVIRQTKAMNEVAWSHAFKFQFSSTESAKFTPIMWGYQWLLVRRDLNS